MIGPENRMFSLVLSPQGRIPLESEGESPSESSHQQGDATESEATPNECLMLEGLQGAGLP